VTAPAPGSGRRSSHLRAVPAFAGPLQIDVLPALTSGINALTSPGLAGLTDAGEILAGNVGLQSTELLRECFKAFPHVRWDRREPEPRPGAAALRAALEARTTEQFGRALDQLRIEMGLSMKELVYELEVVGHCLSLSTVSRSCGGKTLFRNAENLRAFVLSCGLSPDDATEWVRAWERVRTAEAVGRLELTVGSASAPPTAAPAEGTATAEPAEGDPDEVLGEITVQITRRHVRMAIGVLAVMGLVAAGGATPAGKTIGTAALAVAGGLALLERGQALAQTSDRVAG
jgi:hypothetical protein